MFFPERVARSVPLAAIVAFAASATLATGCASNRANNRPARPMVASVQPVAMPPAPPRDIEESPSAGALLERGLTHFHGRNFGVAAAAFGEAVSTGQLNDAGRALAYWHIYAAQLQRGKVDASADALSSFVVVAEDVISMRDEVRFVVDESGDFIDRFNLHARLDRARALLSAAWAQRSDSFGRSADLPVPVRTSAELHYFLEAATPCEDASNRHPVFKRRETEVAGEPVDHVTFRCGNEEEVIDYYFTIPPQE